MTEAQFLQQFNPVIEAFPKKFPTIVLERIHAKCQDLTPTQMRELCHLIIDTCDHAPKAHKVWELANLIRGRAKQGIDQPVGEVRPNCAFCLDLAVIRAIATDGTHETLMRCECANVVNRCPWKLPQWTRHWAPLYEKHRCPVDWFKPDNLSVTKIENLNEKMKYWRAKIRIAEEFWFHQKQEVEAMS